MDEEDGPPHTSCLPRPLPRQCQANLRPDQGMEELCYTLLPSHVQPCETRGCVCFVPCSFSWTRTGTSGRGSQRCSQTSCATMLGRWALFRASPWLLVPVCDALSPPSFQVDQAMSAGLRQISWSSLNVQTFLRRVEAATAEFKRFSKQVHASAYTNKSLMCVNEIPPCSICIACTVHVHVVWILC